MKRISMLVVGLLVVMAPARSFGMMSIEEVSRERARALGLEITAGAAGPDVVRVVLSFDVKGELRGYSRVDLEMRDGGTLLLSSTLREEGTVAGRVVVSFAVDRKRLDKVVLRVVTEAGPRSRTGHDVRVGDFVELGKVK